MGCTGSKSDTSDGSQLTEDVKHKVRESWTMYIKDENFKNNACLIFVKLFEMAPESKQLFNFVNEVTHEALTGNQKLHQHAQRVTDAISLVVNNMDDVNTVQEAVKGLGGRHVQYGAKEAYIQPVAQGVLYSLEQSLKNRFTKEHKKAWLVVLTMVGKLFTAGLKERSED